MERVGIPRVQIAGSHVELPMVTAIGEANARDIGSSIFVHVINCPPPDACQGYPTASLAGWKDHIRIGDGVAIGVTDLELDRNGAAGLALVHARAIGVDWR